MERAKEMIQGSSNSRTAIFASIRENLAKSKPFDKDHCEQDRVSEAPLGVAAHDLLEVFRESVEQVGAKCTFVENENEAANRVRGIINDLSATEIIVSDSELVHRVVNMAQIDAIGNASRDELFSSDVGITSAQWAIAETGTLVLESRAERHRLLSLVPPVHVCIVKSISIRQSMAEILDLLDTDADPSVTFITGASRTSDIELTLVIGVHGPGELHVIVIKDR
ncbi:MAG: lactate utilization protein C [Pyrinomonadaceae bacterium]